jgi:hypothetical protein
MFRLFSYAALLGLGIAGCDCGTDPLIAADAGPGGPASDAGIVNPADRQVRTTVGPSAGGGTMTSDNFKVRLVIGAPAPVGQGNTADSTVKLGTGSAQHGQ